MQRKTPIKRTTGLKRKTPLKRSCKPIPKVSSRMKIWLKSYKEIAKQLLKEQPECEMKIPGICTHIATTVHHKQGRYGLNLVDRGKMITGCLPCHRWITDHSKEAIEMGLSERRNT